MAAHKDKLLAPNPALNQGDERRDAVCKNVSFQISNDIILNPREKISLNKPFHYAQPRKPHPGVSQQNVDQVTVLETFHSDVCTSYEVLCNSWSQQYHLSASAAWKSQKKRWGRVKRRDKGGGGKENLTLLRLLGNISAARRHFM